MGVGKTRTRRTGSVPFRLCVGGPSRWHVPRMGSARAARFLSFVGFPNPKFLPPSPRNPRSSPSIRLVVCVRGRLRTCGSALAWESSWKSSVSEPCGSRSRLVMEGSEGDGGAPDSWELADLDESMSRLVVSSSSISKKKTPPPELVDDAPELASTPGPLPVRSSSSPSLADTVDQVDQFLREALEKPRERLASKLMNFRFDARQRDCTSYSCFYYSFL